MYPFDNFIFFNLLSDFSFSLKTWTSIIIWIMSTPKKEWLKTWKFWMKMHSRPARCMLRWTS